jgi:hypothetical protein
MKVIKETRTFTDGYRTANFKMISDETPTREEVAASQIRCGYHPAGYDGPWDIKTEKDTENNFVTTWRCAGSCD